MSDGVNWLRAAFTQNLALKALALFTSTFLFFQVRGTEEVTTSIPVDVMPLLPSSTGPVMLTSEIPTQLRLTLRGSQSVLNTVRREGIRSIQMDLRRADMQYFYFDRGEFELPAGVEIVQVAPTAVQLNWVPRADRTVPIDLLYEGAIAEGHLLSDTSVNPPTAIIRGPASEVRRLERVRTEPVAIQGLSDGEHRRRARLIPLPDHVSYVDPSNATVAVTIQVQEEVDSASFENLRLVVVGSGNFHARPERVQVDISGVRSLVARVSAAADRIVPFVEVEQLTPEDGAQPRRVRIRGLPEGLEARVEPADVLLVPDDER